MFVDTEYETKAQKQKTKIKPVILEMEKPDIQPMDIYREISGDSGFILESREGKEKLARFSFMGLKPIIKTKIKNELEIEGDPKYLEAIRIDNNGTAIDKIKKITECFHYTDTKIPRFDGGAVGYFSYDVVGEIHKNIEKPEKTVLAEFMICRQYLIFDHREEKLYLTEITINNTENPETIDKAKNNLLKLKEKINSCKKTQRGLEKTEKNCEANYKSNIDREKYMEIVKKTKKYIEEGEIFQAVISRRLDAEYTGDPFKIYEALDKINPSPYMYYVDFGENQVIGSSPEMLVRVQDNEVMTVPIAGTRKRGDTENEDKELAEELLKDEKEIAEHVMLVDLARNDIGRVSKFGSVDVTDYKSIEKFSHVQHITSRVKGEIKEDLDTTDVLKSCFPAGTVSGAPKIRAMEIIDELEPDPRGPYAGAVGYIGFNGNMDFAIAIRTIIKKGEIASLQLGAGIVHDSDPEREWIETKEKGMAGLKAIEMAGGS